MSRVDFWDRLDRGGDCWLWTGAKDPSGYGVLSIDGRLEGTSLCLVPGQRARAAGRHQYSAVLRDQGVLPTGAPRPGFQWTAQSQAPSPQRRRVIG